MGRVRLICYRYMIEIQVTSCLAMYNNITNIVHLHEGTKVSVDLLNAVSVS